MNNKVRRTLLILVALIVILLPFLSACGPDETEQFVYWATLWAKARGIIDESENPDYPAAMRFVAAQAFGFGSTGDEEADAAIDCARLLKKIRQAEDEAGCAWQALEAGKNIRAEVLPHLDKAISLRPDDWSLRNVRAAVYLEDLENPDGVKNARGDFDKADALAEKSGITGEYLRMLRDRAQALARVITFNGEQQIYPVKETLEEQSRTCDELYSLTGDNDYLLMKEQANNNIQQRRYRERS